MTYAGHVEDGKVVFDEPLNLANGTRVVVEVAEVSVRAPHSSRQETLAERLASVIGTAEGLPEDASVNLDHYLYGVPKDE